MTLKDTPTKQRRKMRRDKGQSLPHPQRLGLLCLDDLSHFHLQSRIKGLAPEWSRGWGWNLTPLTAAEHSGLFLNCKS